MQAKFTELNALVAQAHRSSAKLEGGVKAESARCRSALSDAAKCVAQLRKDCLACVKSMPTKPKAVKQVVAAEELLPPPVLEREVTGAVDIEDLIEQPKKKVVRKRAKKA